MSCCHKFRVKNKYGQFKLAPCGQCINCISSKQRYLSHKIQGDVAHHAHNNIGSSFVTLTVDDNHTTHSVQKAELQKFIKRLRKNTGVDFKHLSIGDYGDQTQRNHYHSLLIGFPSELRDYVRKSWDFGFSSTDAITPVNINYVVRYLSKFTSDYKNLFDEQNLEPPFSIRSHDIGKYFFDDNFDLISETGTYLHKGQVYPVSVYDLAKYFGHTPPDPDLSHIIELAQKYHFSNAEDYMNYYSYMREQSLLRNAQNKLKPPQGVKSLNQPIITFGHHARPDFSGVLDNISF